jgi:hypothetical protein
VELKEVVGVSGSDEMEVGLSVETGIGTKPREKLGAMLKSNIGLVRKGGPPSELLLLLMVSVLDEVLLGES